MRVHEVEATALDPVLVAGEQDGAPALQLRRAEDHGLRDAAADQQLKDAHSCLTAICFITLGEIPNGDPI